MGMIFVARALSPAEEAALRADPSLAAGLIHGDPEPELDLDKAWHGLHYLLTGNDWEATPGAGEAVLGGDPTGDDLGYGPARLLPADRVREVAAALRDVTAETLGERYDPAAMLAAGLYPQVWDDEEFELYLLPNFRSLRTFYLAAAEQGRAVLLAIT